MSIRTININLEEQYPRPRTLGFFPDQTPREDDLLLDEVYIAKTDATGAGSIDLPVKASGTIHYRVEIDGIDAGSFNLVAGAPIDFEDILLLGTPPSDPLIDYIDDKLEGYAPLAGANFTGPVNVPGQAYGPAWDGSSQAPTKNDVYDALESAFTTASPDYRRKIVHFSDCNWQNVSYDGGFAAYASAAGMFNWVLADWANYPDALGLTVIHLRNGATNSAAIFEVSPFTAANSQFAILGRGVTKAKFRFGFLTLSDAVNTYAVRSGVHNGGGGNAPTFGCYFRYRDAVNGGKWEAVCKNTAGETAQDTGIVAAVGGLHTFEVAVNATGTSAAFYLDGVLTNTITTNIPILASEVIGASFQMLRSVGVADVDIMVIDYARSEWNLTTPRP